MQLQSSLSHLQNNSRPLQKKHRHRKIYPKPKNRVEMMSRSLRRTGTLLKMRRLRKMTRLQKRRINQRKQVKLCILRKKKM